jgi:hypothetical protein
LAVKGHFGQDPLELPQEVRVHGMERGSLERNLQEGRRRALGLDILPVDGLGRDLRLHAFKVLGSPIMDHRKKPPYKTPPEVPPDL